MILYNFDTIIYHGSCPDGWCSAYLARQACPGAELVPFTHGTRIDPEQYRDREVLMVDISWDRPNMDKLQAVAKSLLVLDHHKTAQAALDGFPGAVFDMTRSGAGLTWDTLRIGPRPWFVWYVEDRDLWRWAFPDSKAVSAYIMAIPQKTEAWDELYQMTPFDAAQKGKAILLHIDHYVDSVVRERQMGMFQGLTTAVINAPYINISDACHQLCSYAQIGMGWFERSDGQIQFSLRSEGDLDVSAIAKAYGGGGHKNASGFQLLIPAGRALLDRILGR
jgi:oligoribonuclease NrnB/cAMP/cGMP phosphodiesterase (DHH superfamily)